MAHSLKINKGDLDGQTGNVIAAGSSSITTDFTLIWTQPGGAGVTKKDLILAMTSFTNYLEASGIPNPTSVELPTVPET